MTLSHHESGFRGLELQSKLSKSKKQFNVNSQTVSHERYNDNSNLRFKKSKNRESGYNLVTGATNIYQSAKETNARLALLPPPKNFTINNLGKREYTNTFAASPKPFHRLNGDFTHFSGMRQANSLISSKNLTPKMSSSLFAK